MARRRGYSDQEVDEYVEVEQLRRADERRNDPRWELVEDDLTAVIGGGIWRERKD